MLMQLRLNPISRNWPSIRNLHYGSGQTGWQVACQVSRKRISKTHRKAPRLSPDEVDGPTATLPPRRRRYAEVFLEHGGEQSRMLEVTVHADVDDLGVRLQQQQPRPVQAEVNLFGEEADAKPRLEQPAEMTHAAAA